MSAVALPHYSPPLSPAPDYSTEPTFGELTLQQGPRRSRRRPSSTFVRKDGHITIALDGQEEGALYPTYGRHSMISGMIIFGRADFTYEVALHISGKMETTSSESGPNITPLIDKKMVLWNIEADGNGVERPTQIKFTVQLPHTFNNGEEVQQLPPSYRADFDTLPAMMVRSSYGLEFSFLRNPSRKLSLFNKNKCVFIPFHYYPRTRSLQPLLHTHCFSSDIKSSPERWYQAMVAVTIPKKPELAPIYFHLFVPTSCIYSVRELIPFHLQVNGPPESLHALLYPPQGQKHKGTASKNGGVDSVEDPSSLGVPPWTDKLSYQIKAPIVSSLFAQSSTVSSSPIPSSFSPGRWPNVSGKNEADDKRPTPRVSILRRVTLKSRDGKEICRKQCLGVWKPQLVPPSPDYPNGHADEHLDWEGVLRVSKEFKTGSFRAGPVDIKDYIAISIMPHSEATSPLHGLEVTVPIKLVTDPFTEATSAEE